MFLFLSLTGIIISVILLVFNAGRYRSALFLGGFFFLISLYAFNQYVLLASRSIQLMSVFIVHPAFLFFMIGPMLYWYVRSVLTDRASFQLHDLWHLAPAIIYLLSTIPYMALPWPEKEANAALLIADVDNIMQIKTSLLLSVMHPALIFIFRPLLVLIYALWSLGIFIRWLRSRQNTRVFSQQRYMIPWLTVMLGFVFILTISHLVALLTAFHYHNVRIYYTLDLLHLLFGAGMAGLMISPLFFPSILYGLPRIPGTGADESPLKEFPVTSNPSESASDEAASLSVREAPAKPQYEAAYLDQISAATDDCMQRLQPYLQHDCNLAYMAKLTNIPAHHLAYYFREVKQQPFNDYRNEWRVKHAKNLIVEGKTKELTMEAIGLLSGFSTRNTFYTAFKKCAGVSPSAFKDQE